MCEHEGTTCPGYACMCACMNCMSPDEDEASERISCTMSDIEDYIESLRALGRTQSELYQALYELALGYESREHDFALFLAHKNGEAK